MVIFRTEEVTVPMASESHKGGILIFAALEQTAMLRLLFVLFLNERQGEKETPTQSGKAWL